MEKVNSEEFSALKCVGCSGIWFQDGSHELAKSIEGVSNIDKNTTNSQAAYNEMRDIDCPECSKKMIKMIDRGQYHIQFEACTYCNGVYFDAGEFKDLTEFTLMERIKQAVQTLKSNINA